MSNWFSQIVAFDKPRVIAVGDHQPRGAMAMPSLRILARIALVGAAMQIPAPRLGDRGITSDSAWPKECRRSWNWMNIPGRRLLRLATELLAAAAACRGQGANTSQMKYGN